MNSYDVVRKILFPAEHGGMTLEEIEECYGTDDFNVIFMLNESELVEKYNRYMLSKGLNTGVMIMVEGRIGIITKADGEILNILYTDGNVQKIKISSIKIDKILSDMSLTINHMLDVLKYAPL